MSSGSCTRRTDGVAGLIGAATNSGDRLRACKPAHVAAPAPIASPGAPRPSRFDDRSSTRPCPPPPCRGHRRCGVMSSGSPRAGGRGRRQRRRRLPAAELGLGRRGARGRRPRPGRLHADSHPSPSEQARQGQVAGQRRHHPVLAGAGVLVRRQVGQGARDSPGCTASTGCTRPPACRWRARASGWTASPTTSMRLATADG